MSFIDKLLGNDSASRLKKLQPYVKKINSLEPVMQAMCDAELAEQTDKFKKRIERSMI